MIGGRGFLGGVAKGAENFILNREAALAKLAAQEQKNEAERIKQERAEALKRARDHEDRAKVGRVPSHILERVPPMYDTEIAEEKVVTTEGFMRVRPTLASEEAAKLLGLTPTFIDTPQTKGALIEAFIPAETKSLPKKEDVPTYYNKDKNTLTSKGQNWLNRYNSLYPRRQMEEEQLVNAFKEIMAPTGKKADPTIDSKASIGWVTRNPQTAKIELTEAGEIAYGKLEKKYPNKEQFISFLYNQSVQEKVKTLAQIHKHKNSQPSSSIFKEFDPHHFNVPVSTSESISISNPTKNQDSALSYLMTLEKYAIKARQLDEDSGVVNSNAWQTYFLKTLKANNHHETIEKAIDVLQREEVLQDGTIRYYEDIDRIISPRLSEILENDFGKNGKRKPPEKDNVNNIGHRYPLPEMTRLSNTSTKHKTFILSNSKYVEEIVQTEEYTNFKATNGESEEYNRLLFQKIEEIVSNDLGDDINRPRNQQKVYNLIGLLVSATIPHTEKVKNADGRIKIAKFNPNRVLKPNSREAIEINRQDTQSQSTLRYVNNLESLLKEQVEIDPRLDLNTFLSDVWFSLKTIGKNIRGIPPLLGLDQNSTEKKFNEYTRGLRENLETKLGDDKTSEQRQVLRHLNEFSKKVDINKDDLSEEAYKLKAQLGFAKVQLAYQLAGLFQGGGTGSRTISDQDFKIIMTALDSGTTASLRSALTMLQDKLKADIAIAQYQRSSGDYGVHTAVGQKLVNTYISYVDYKNRKREEKRTSSTKLKPEDKNFGDDNSKITAHIKRMNVGKGLDYSESKISVDRIKKLQQFLESNIEDMSYSRPVDVSDESKETARHLLKLEEETKSFLKRESKLQVHSTSNMEYYHITAAALDKKFKAVMNNKKIGSKERTDIMNEIRKNRIRLDKIKKDERWSERDGEIQEAKLFMKYFHKLTSRLKRENISSYFKLIPESE